MPVFKNISNQVYQDGDLEVQPGGSFTTDDPGRATIMRRDYKWQFDESEGNDAPAVGDAEVDATLTGTRELREGGRVQLDAEGNQASVVSGDGPDTKKKK